MLFQQEDATGEVAIKPPIELFKANHSDSLGQVESIGLTLQACSFAGSTAEKAAFMPPRKSSSASIIVELVVLVR